MFLCDECHAKTGCERLHAFRSHGPCEMCHKVADCVDCREYKRTGRHEVTVYSDESLETVTSLSWREKIVCAVAKVFKVGVVALFRK